MDVEKVLEYYSQLFSWEKERFIEKIIKNANMDSIDLSRTLSKIDEEMSYQLIRHNLDDNEILENIVDESSITDYVSRDRTLIGRILEETLDIDIKNIIANDENLKIRLEDILTQINNSRK